ncbi:MAG: DUF547 domain-containing protein [Hyphomicrobiaceae bacterium]|nr:DUF547 domain-containing protein [Hyphomicrobiaceae bacterium]
MTLSVLPVSLSSAPAVLIKTARQSGYASVSAFGSVRLRVAVRAALLGSVMVQALCQILPIPAALAANTITDAFRPNAAGATATIDHSVWDQLLKTFVKPSPDGVNRVDYKAFKDSSHAVLKSYVARLEAADPGTLDRPEQFAFWANLYNAKTIDIVLDHYPVASIRDISLESGLFDFLKKSVGAGGPWKAEVVRVKGRALSLDNIEHDILRPVFKDPRVHYAVNCSSYGCPNLMTEAFTGAKLDMQLDAGARAFVNHPRGIRVVDGSLMVSSIYSWFKADFGGDDAGVLAHVRRYAAPPLAAKLDGVTAIGGHDYDWRLNDVQR